MTCSDVHVQARMHTLTTLLYIVYRVYCVTYKEGASEASSLLVIIYLYMYVGKLHVRINHKTLL